jgi:hypothetical protein
MPNRAFCEQMDQGAKTDVRKDKHAGRARAWQGDLSRQHAVDSMLLAERSGRRGRNRKQSSNMEQRFPAQIRPSLSIAIIKASSARVFCQDGSWLPS